ncbi:MAG: sugar transferase [Leptolyngbyaceae bacterium]|nr:sugar transferase [Leptolyngbyaceae bacterium]
MVNLESRECQITVDEHVGHIKLPRTLTVLEAVAFKQSFQDLCQSNPYLAKAELDFSDTRFIDSSGIGAMMGVWKIAQQHEVQFSLHNVPQQVMMSLSLAGLDQYLDIQSTLPSPHDSDKKTLGSLGSAQHSSPATHPSVRSPLKRLMDIVGGCIGLAITALLFIPIAIAIKIEDGGPIFFSQTRCSWMGRRFTIWKFRSMVVDAEALKEKLAAQNEVKGAIFKMKDDPRITRVGSILRKTSLDEFPQFWNVVKGDMSLVGTRPPTPDEIEMYEIPQWQRLDVKPGLTGEWQVNGRSSVKDFEDVIQMDLRYQERWSLLYDFQLIFRTIAVLFSRDSGAY